MNGDEKIRKEFRIAINQLREHNETLSAIDHRLKEEYEERVKTAFCQRFPKKSYGDFSKALMALPNWETYVDEQEEIFEREWKIWKKRRDELEECCSELAKSMSPRKCEEWVKWKSVSSSSYHTQGFGAESYAKNAAEMDADVARLYGLPVRVVRSWIPNTLPRTPGPFVSAGGHIRFEVQVQADQLDLEILNRKPGIPLREHVRLCWSRGVNPRVYNPFLPVGYEEAQGLDYFGNDLRAQKENKCP